MSSRKIYWFLISALSLTPLTAFAQQAVPVVAATGVTGPTSAVVSPPASTPIALQPTLTDAQSRALTIRALRDTQGNPVFKELTLDEAKATFEDFAVVSDVNRSGQKVARLEGKIFKACLAENHMRITNTATAVDGKGAIGFFINDGDGAKVRNCVSTLKDRGVSCAEVECTDISQFGAGSTLILPDADVSIGLIHHNPNKPVHQPVGIHHQSKLSLARIESDRVAAKHAALLELEKRKIERLKHTVKHCIKEDDLPLAEQALEELYGMIDALSDDQYEAEQKRLTREKRKRELESLGEINKRIADASAEDIELIKAELGLWLDENKKNHKDAADRIAVSYHQISLRQIKLGKNSPDSFLEASNTVSEAKGLKGLSEKTSNTLDGYLRSGIPTQYAASMVPYGANNPMFWGTWNYAMNSVQNYMFETCYAQPTFQPQNPYGMPMPAGLNSACPAEGDFAKLNQLPGQAQAIDQQRMQWQQQRQQAMAQAQGQGQVQGQNFGNPQQNFVPQNGNGSFGMNPPPQQFNGQAGGMTHWAGGQYGNANRSPNGVLSPNFN